MKRRPGIAPASASAAAAIAAVPVPVLAAEPVDSLAGAVPVADAHVAAGTASVGGHLARGSPGSAPVVSLSDTLRYILDPPTLTD